MANTRGRGIKQSARVCATNQGPHKPCYALPTSFIARSPYDRDHPATPLPTTQRCRVSGNVQAGGRDQLFASPLPIRAYFASTQRSPRFSGHDQPVGTGLCHRRGHDGHPAAQHARPDSQIYDLGCSWGASLLSAAREPACDRCALIGIDNSEAMVEQAGIFGRIPRSSADSTPACRRVEHPA